MLRNRQVIKPKLKTERSVICLDTCSIKYGVKTIRLPSRRITDFLFNMIEKCRRRQLLNVREWGYEEFFHFPMTK